MVAVTSWLGLALAPTIVGAKTAVIETSKTTLDFLDQAGYDAYSDAGGAPIVIGNIIGIVLSLLGVVCLIYAVYAGVKWMTAGGNAEQVDEAKAALRNAAIGLAIVLLAYAIVLAIFTVAGFGFNTGLTNWSNADR
ncbi:MAG: hypothetical protein AAB817_01525 [Patescibacteria group bacterium]